MAHTAHAPAHAAAAHGNDAHEPSHGGDHHGHAPGEFAHPLPPSILLGTFAALVALTLITVALAGAGLGKWEVWTSLIIASIKAGLVMAYFMHLRWDKPFNVLLILGSLVFVTLFLGFTLMDSYSYRDQLELKTEGAAVISPSAEEKARAKAASAATPASEAAPAEAAPAGAAVAAP
jgi:cytochrome c oxidase subunit IV